MDKPKSMIMVIFGASGDLTRRKLMPALYLLYKLKKLPENFAVLGVARTQYTDDEYRERINLQLHRFLKTDDINEALISSFVNMLHYFSMDPANPNDYLHLQPKLLELDAKIESGEQYLYYLVPSQLVVCGIHP